MNVYISADIEGVTGVVTWKQCGAPDGSCYDWAFARRMMTHDVNAAIRGARAGGARRIVVKDSHNVGLNLLIDELEPGVELISGTRPGPGGMMEGIDQTFDKAFLVGYHGMAGSTDGVMEHTISGRVHRLWIDGEQQGEMGLSAFEAASHGVPIVLAISDDKGVAEAKSLIPGIVTATTKFGMGRFMARLRHPSETGTEIESAAQASLSAVVGLPSVQGGHVAEIEFNRSEETDNASQLLGWERIDAYRIRQEFGTWQQTHVAIRRAISFAGM